MKRIAHAHAEQELAQLAIRFDGLDHGVGHPLLLLYDVKAPNSQNSNEFKVLCHYPSDVSLSIFRSKSKCIICTTI
jgi:hypothetical protein